MWGSRLARKRYQDKLPRLCLLLQFLNSLFVCQDMWVELTQHHHVVQKREKKNEEERVDRGYSTRRRKKKYIKGTSTFSISYITTHFFSYVQCSVKIQLQMQNKTDCYHAVSLKVVIAQFRLHRFSLCFVFCTHEQLARNFCFLLSSFFCFYDICLHYICTRNWLHIIFDCVSVYVSLWGIRTTASTIALHLRKLLQIIWRDKSTKSLFRHTYISYISISHDYKFLPSDASCLLVHILPTLHYNYN